MHVEHMHSPGSHSGYPRIAAMLLGQPVASLRAPVLWPLPVVVSANAFVHCTPALCTAAQMEDCTKPHASGAIAQPLGMSCVALVALAVVAETAAGTGRC